MSTDNKEILKSKYFIFPKSCIKANWPLNADLFFTRLPAVAKDGYSKGLIGFIANRAYFSLHNNSLAFVMVSSFKEKKSRPYEIIDIFKSAGFKFIDSIIWLKNKYSSIPGSKRFNNVYDFMFMFAKGTNYHLNRGAIAYLKNRLEFDNDNEYICPGNVWKIKIDEKKYVPEELIECIINVGNLIPNSLIIDCCMGYGTALQVALKMGHSFWGCEADAKKYNYCKNVIKKFEKEKKDVVGKDDSKS